MQLATCELSEILEDAALSWEDGTQLVRIVLDNLGYYHRRVSTLSPKIAERELIARYAQTPDALTKMDVRKKTQVLHMRDIYAWARRVLV